MKNTLKAIRIVLLAAVVMVSFVLPVSSIPLLSPVMVYADEGGEESGGDGADGAGEVHDRSADGLVSGPAAAVELELHVEECDVESAGAETGAELGEEEEGDD